MRGLRRYSGSVGLLVSAILTQAAWANLEEEDDEYELHWVDKSLNIFQHVKRKAVCQVDGWLLCPSSVGGGCCPPNFECGTASCFATTAGPTSCNGKTGYYNCPLTLGPGSCCQVGLICNDNGGCDPPPGVTVSPSCPANWIGCAVSFGGGCCRSGQVCGSGVCYNATPQTLPVSETKTTTNSNGHTTITVVTSMTVITDVPSTSSGSATAAGVPQLVPSTVAKLDAIQTGDSEGGGHGGLSSGALGGIVTGVIVLLIAIVVAATFIVLRLKKTEKAARDAEKAAESRHESSNSQPRSHKSGFGQPTISEIDSTTDADPVHRFPIMRPSPHLRSRSATTGTTDGSPSPTPNFTHSDTSSPPLWGMPFNYPPEEDNAPVRMSQRVSVDSGGTCRHFRQPSDSSELEGPHGESELEATENNEAGSRRRSNSNPQSAKTHVRRNSDMSGQNRARGDSNTGTLGTVAEMIELHGHYGPADTAAGQTAANLNRGPSSVTSAPGHQDT
ncbi:hypothetical protein F5Y12DRAFT_423094 [Xylaria sp. FL1777]|nr:hypothetical protein F5Y12DRAFT_423094 [Xylaria sp. FL1777]